MVKQVGHANCSFVHTGACLPATADAEIGPKYPPSSESADCRFLTKSSSAATTWQPLPDGQRTAAALKAKGYDYRFVFSKATGHCDGKVFQQTLADTLVWMWRGYKAE